MASKAVTKVAGGAMLLSHKQTLQSKGMWEILRRTLAVDPERSNGIPLNPYFRNPPPGALDPQTYHDPVTMPAGDVADNPYWKRDNRRNYPRLSVVKQADAVALLSVGSAATPKGELVGEAGEKAVVAAKEEGEGGLAAFIRKNGQDVEKDVLRGGRLPPLPSGERFSAEKGEWEGYKYEVTDMSYPDVDRNPCRSFK